MKPACYPTQKLYDDWRRVASLAREECTPCTDCSKKFAYEMRERGKCQPAQVKAIFRFTLGKQSPDNSNPSTTGDEDEHP